MSIARCVVIEFFVFGLDIYLIYGQTYEYLISASGIIDVCGTILCIAPGWMVFHPYRFTCQISLSFSFTLDIKD